MPLITKTDEFLSEEDRDLENLSEEELFRWWDEWLIAAQRTNDEDQNSYSHGVFREYPFSTIENIGRMPMPRMSRNVTHAFQLAKL